MTYKSLLIVATIGLLGSPLAAESITNPLTPSPTWDDLIYDVVEDAVIADGSTIIDLEAPFRAHDAATVPIILRQLDPTITITSATVVIDENPAPIAAVLGFSPAMHPIDFEMRVRVNQYSNVRVIADTDKGLVMSGRYVRASGGCSAPASRDPQSALSTMGEMRLRSFENEPQMSQSRQEAQIMIRHPNYSGLQRDQISQLFIPAHFIDHLEVWQGDEVLFTLDGGISVSENPVFRFSYLDNGAPSLSVIATDTDGNQFETVLAKSSGS